MPESRLPAWAHGRGTSRGDEFPEGSFPNPGKLLREQPDLEREVDVIATVRKPKFLVDPLLVGVDGLGADEQLLANLGRAVPAGDELEDVLLALGEFLEHGAFVRVLRSSLDSLGQGASRGRLHVDIAVGDGANRVDELAVGGTLDQVSAGARFQQGDEIRVLGVHREDQHLPARLLSDQLLGGLGAVHFTHREVHHDHVRIEPLREGDGILAGGSLTDNLDILGGAEHRLEAGTHDTMVVDENHSNDAVSQAASVSIPIHAMTRVPRSPAVSICNSPPASESRSRIAARPDSPRFFSSGPSNPRPSSLTSSST